MVQGFSTESLWWSLPLTDQRGGPTFGETELKLVSEGGVERVEGFRGATEDAAQQRLLGKERGKGRERGRERRRKGREGEREGRELERV